MGDDIIVLDYYTTFPSITTLFDKLIVRIFYSLSLVCIMFFGDWDWMWKVPPKKFDLGMISGLTGELSPLPKLTGDYDPTLLLNMG